ncbi:MAG: hypothetical protein LBU41_05290 [Clostridiales Family XIII bacterium]|nr:hypothetical protein [Clostridiales Family XIII bacterium]
MKKMMRKTAVTLITIGMLLVFPVVAFAADTDFNGEGAVPVWDYDSMTATAYGYDYFGNATKNLSPGDMRNVTVTLRNNTADNVEFRLVVSPLTGKDAQDLESYYSDKTADDSLLDEIGLVVSHNGAPIYNGTLRGTSGGSAAMYQTAGVSLGTVPAGYSGNLTFELSVPASLDAGAMNTLCAIEWRFIATQYNNPSGPGPDPDPGPGPTPTPTPTPGPTTPTQVAPAVVVPPVVGDTPITELPSVAPPASSGTSGGSDVTVDADPIAKSAGSGRTAWALCNLLLTILAGLLMVGIIARYIIVHRKSRENEDDTARDRVRKALVAGLVGLLATIAAVLLFILTENMKLPMEFVNLYTPLYVLLVLVECLFLLFSTKKRTYSTAR